MSRRSENPTASDEERSILCPPGLSSAEPEFSPVQRRILLQAAHQAIVSGVRDEPYPEPPVHSSGVAASLWTALLAPRGVFTTLYLEGELRGCVGYAAAIHPLYRAVQETARAAAFEDSRFSPVLEEEASKLRISVSVLSPLFPIQAPQVEVGRHGLVVSDGMRRGLLLPQVPVEHGWDREAFLDQTCRKAGLPSGAWKRPSVNIEAFTAEVFGDDGVYGSIM